MTPQLYSISVSELLCDLPAGVAPKLFQEQKLSETVHHYTTAKCLALLIGITDSDYEIEKYKNDGIYALKSRRGRKICFW